MVVSKNKDDVVFIFYDFRRIIKKIPLKNKNCVNKNIQLNHNNFKIKADILCVDNNALIDTFISYRDVSLSHRDVLVMPLK